MKRVFRRLKGNDRLSYQDWIDRNRADPVNRGLLFSLPMFEGVGENLTDVARHHPVTMVHTPVWTMLTSGLPVLEFDGANDYMQITAANSLDLDLTGDMSIAAWVYSDDFSAAKILAGRYEVDASGWESYFFDTTFNLRTHQAGAHTGVSGAGFETGAWMFVSVSRHGLYPLMYRDGKAVTMTYGAGITDPVSSGQDLTLGVRYSKNANYFDGKLWGLRIWGREVDGSEFRRLYLQERGLIGA
jgi:hypothetical protein